jgi:hypothetical protein
MLERLTDAPITNARRSNTAVVLALFALLFVSTSSQWGMILLSSIYAIQGRGSLPITPELVGGTVAVLASLMVLAVTRVHFVWSRTTWFLVLPLLAFVLVATVSEVIRTDVQWRNIVMFASLVIYFLLGGICGYILAPRHLTHVAGLLLLVFLGWYLGLTLLAIVGFLGYENVLTGADTLRRLEVLGGFTATELPIFVGLQLPFVLAVAFGSFGRLFKLSAYVLLLLAFALLYLTASVGALMATALVIAIFAILGPPRSRSHALRMLVAVSLITALAGGDYVAELVTSVTEKVEIVEGGGGRAESNSLLLTIALENPWIGIGKSRFQEVNNLGYFGEGIYPHNNLLGISAELGLLAAILYGAFAIGLFWHLVSRALWLQRMRQYRLSLVLVAIIGVFAYQQFRGLLHDTWTVKELYFWIGFGVGITTLVARKSWRLGQARAQAFAPAGRPNSMQA